MLPSDYLIKGWCQGAYGKDDGGSVCLVGAADMCWDSAESRSGQFFLTATRILGVEGGLGDLFDWNDAPERTQAEVVALARKVEEDMGLREIGGGEVAVETEVALA